MADCDSGTLIDHIDHNTYAGGIGGHSTNGFEYLVSSGIGEVGHVTISNSTFSNDPGDMLEEFDRGINSIQALTLDNVHVDGTTISGGLPAYADPAGTATTPDNTGECFGIGSVGSGDHTQFTMHNSTFANCGNNGIEVTNNHVTADGPASPDLVSLDIERSRIANVRYYGLWFNGVTPLGQLRVKVQDSDLADAGGVEAGFDQQPTGSTASSLIDLGGGQLGSAGGNCITGGSIYDMESTGFTVSAEHDWWGSPGGPAAGADQIIPPGGVIKYYNKVESTIGSGVTQSFARLFLAPGDGHCGGDSLGPVPSNPFAAVVNWVQNGIAPSTIQATTRNSSGAVTESRPLCAYPDGAEYVGSGSLAEPQNFVCAHTFTS